MSDGPTASGPIDPGERPRIVRRRPDEPRTGIIRRHPTGPLPRANADERTGIIDGPADERTGIIGASAAGDDAPTSYVPRATPMAVGPPPRPSPRGAAATATVSILSGWATAVIATDLITGWWHTDRLFCVAIGFLTAVSAAATIGGLIALLLRRRMGRLLIVVGAVIALLIFASLFVAGAKLHPVVYAIPVLPLASIVLAALGETRRWAGSG